MSIHFISGKPGAGKSLYAVRLMIDELVHGTRVIITNLPLRLGELNAYLQREWPGRTIDLFERVRLLDDDETGAFWTIRPGWTGSVLSKEEWRSGKKPSYEGAPSGVMYIIDEIHNYFGARQWMDTGQDVLYYISQHRKLGDTLICITQAINNVDKQFRSVTQDYTFIRNLAKEKWGLVKMPSLFTRKTFLSPPTETSTPVETGTFKLDVSGLATCYDTAQGVGIHGRFADQGERRKGLPWYVVAVGFVAGLSLFFFYVPKAVAGFLGKTATAGVGAAVHTATGAVGASTGHPVTNAVPAGVTVTKASDQVVRVVEMVEPVYLEGYSMFGGKSFWALSDGRVVTEGAIGNAEWVFFEGRKILPHRKSVLPVRGGAARPGLAGVP